ncbi:P1 family peptidase [Luteimonas sp. e5]
MKPIALAGLLLALLALPAAAGGQDGRAAAGSESAAVGDAASQRRPRAREAGIIIGHLPTGPANAITDVAGVRVGHATVHRGRELHTGVTAILAHGGNAYHERVPAAIHVGNGYGKLIGATQVRELGELETPILLTGTLNVWRVADALAGWMLARPGMQQVRSLNVVVGETNDGWLSDIRARPLGEREVHAALESASTDAPEEGAVGAGAGTVAFGWKGGIGSSSRRVSIDGHGYTVGVLVQSNYGGELVIAGVPVGQRLLPPREVAMAPASGDGSVMIVVATDAPLDARLLERLASRALIGIGRTGSVMANGSGDYVIAFSTAEGMRRRQGADSGAARPLDNAQMTPLFQAVAEASEEAVLNSMFRAHAVQGHRGTAHALPLERLLPLLRQAQVLGPDARRGRP